MIDDLCRVNPREPYRMFTSRAEFRLQLRADNADRRLAGHAAALGLLDAAALATVQRKEANIARALAVLDAVRAQGRTLRELLRRPAVDVAALAAAHPEIETLRLTPDEMSEVEAEVKYEGYVQRQAVDVDRLRRMEARAIPAGFEFGRVTGLSNEAREVLVRRAPMTLGEASRLCGVTPADLNLILVVLARAGSPAARGEAEARAGGPESGRSS
jgi:tRNA uridine 5-carboxymethylaminomethyl modification enzyme